MAYKRAWHLHSCGSPAPVLCSDSPEQECNLVSLHVWFQIRCLDLNVKRQALHVQEPGRTLCSHCSELISILVSWDSGVSTTHSHTFQWYHRSSCSCHHSVHTTPSENSLYPARVHTEIFMSYDARALPASMPSNCPIWPRPHRQGP
jgi:hypothetical protein